MRASAFVLALALTLPVTAAADGTAPKHGKCLDAAQIDTTTALSDDALLIRMRNGQLWQNKLKAHCQGLKFENGVAWVVSGGMICANMQSFRVLRSSNICFLGEFTPYTPPAH